MPALESNCTAATISSNAIARHFWQSGPIELHRVTELDKVGVGRRHRLGEYVDRATELVRLQTHTGHDLRGDVRGLGYLELSSRGKVQGRTDGTQDLVDVETRQCEEAHRVCRLACREDRRLAEALSHVGQAIEVLARGTGQCSHPSHALLETGEHGGADRKWGNGGGAGCHHALADGADAGTEGLKPSLRLPQTARKLVADAEFDEGATGSDALWERHVSDPPCAIAHCSPKPSATAPAASAGPVP